MTRQFVLIDHSIVDSSGHYLEYARRVLRAAKREGFKTVLATNKRAQNLECPEADLILGAFSRSFWENQAQAKLHTIAGFVRKQSALAGDLRSVRQFAKELGLLVAQAAITESDIVFVPTLGGTELVGVSLYSGLKAAKDLSWHLLFRRDVPPPSSWLDIKSYLTQARVRTAFFEANERFKKGSRHFYTDTEELTTRYEKLGVGKFKTLPVPIDDQSGFKKIWCEGPLYVSYLGDMREEKGIHLLPKLIASIRESGFSEAQVRFRIQGNFPADGGTRVARRAKIDLGNKKFTGVDVLEGPFDSEVYRSLVCNSDIVLLPYCAKSYQARSSGIFSEALAAGVPTIFPTESWMARNASGILAGGYKGPAQLVNCLIEMLQDYPANQKASLEYSRQWREKHSPELLVQRLLESASTH